MEAGPAAERLAVEARARKVRAGIQERLEGATVAARPEGAVKERRLAGPVAAVHVRTQRQEPTNRGR